MPQNQLPQVPGLTDTLPSGLLDHVLVAFGAQGLANLLYMTLILLPLILIATELLKLVLTRLGFRLQPGLMFGLGVGEESGERRDSKSWDWGVRGVSAVFGLIFGLVLALAARTWDIGIGADVVPAAGAVLGMLIGGLDIALWHMLRAIIGDKLSALTESLLPQKKE